MQQLIKSIVRILVYKVPNLMYKVPNLVFKVPILVFKVPILMIDKSGVSKSRVEDKVLRP